MEETSNKSRFIKNGKSVTLISVTLSFFCLTSLLHAVNPLKHSKFSEVLNQVNILSPDQPKKHPQVGDIFKAPELLQTGSRSRAELIADDHTIIRVGANTVFSFISEQRTLRLQRGSLLFHSPKGRGGGTIQTASASAAVLGTTIIVTATDDGGFKFLVLEGQGEVRLPNGFCQTVNAGELVFITPGTKKISNPLPYDLSQQIKNSNLVKGFSRPLLSLEKIQRAIALQQKSFSQSDSLQFLARAWKQNKDFAQLDANSFVHFFEINLSLPNKPSEGPPVRSAPSQQPSQNPPRPGLPLPG